MSANTVDLREIMAESFSAFQPFACFDKHMDCIRVFTVDVSVTEARLNEYFTVARANNGIKAGANVGFTIKGVAHLFNTIGLDVSGVYELVDILDKIVKAIPHTAVKRVLEEFSPILKETHVKVDFDAARMAA